SGLACCGSPIDANRGRGGSTTRVITSAARSSVRRVEDFFALNGTMPRYVAFLRGVSPMNAKMPELKRCFESAGFADVKTLLSSGNVVFSARAAAEAALERKAEAAMAKRIGRAFYTIVRPTTVLRRMLEEIGRASCRERG